VRKELARAYFFTYPKIVKAHLAVATATAWGFTPMCIAELIATGLVINALICPPKIYAIFFHFSGWFR
jgi:hypothetical protein